MAAPLYDSLCVFAGTQPLRLHMPGHKGQLPGLFQEIARIDFTEIAPTGNLYTGEGPITDAEALFAPVAGAREALFFSCGSTQGVHTMLSAAVGIGGTLVLDRGCHKSVYHGMALLDISPIYLQPEPLPGTALPVPVSPALLKQTLTEHPEARAVFLTSPSYYGIITDLAPLAEICHRHGAFLLVDQAHGAHFPFVGLPSGVQEGADLCVVSAHKTLPALGSASILYVGAQAPWTGLQLKAMSAVFATTSPSYPILASIDYARQLLEASDSYRRMADSIRIFREKINRDTRFRALTEGPGLRLDPCRLTIDTAAAGLPGSTADQLLQQQNIFVEMSDERYLVAILTCCDTDEDLDRLFSALQALPVDFADVPAELAAPAPPPMRQSIRSALFGPRESVLLKDAVGRISAQIIAPYPPGIPIVAPGEEITEKHIAYLQKKRYNIDAYIDVADSPHIL